MCSGNYIDVAFRTSYVEHGFDLQKEVRTSEDESSSVQHLGTIGRGTRTPVYQ
jgi:hypothetical protein